MTTVYFIIFLLFLFGLFALSLFISALRRLHKRDSKKMVNLVGSLFFYKPLFSFFFPKGDYEGILFSAIVAKNVSQVITLVAGTLWLYALGIGTMPLYAIILLIIALAIAYLAISDYIPRILGSRFPTHSFWFGSISSSLFLILAFPFSAFFILTSHYFLKSLYLDYLDEPMGRVKHEIFEILQEAELSPQLTDQNKKLIESVIHFQNRVVREIMVPRVNIASLDGSTSIQDAVKFLEEEGYSRVPVYKETIDDIVGILMYKDILKKYIEYQQKGNDQSILETPIERILKPVLFVPETKKISNLLQDFRKKQMHLAIIVDEYGGTEGIVTIEDILEEIVGEIEDEYDDASDLFHPLSENSWIVDARMSILDAEEQLGIVLPQEGDYDTIGGYLFHRAGTIPSKGFIIKLDDIDLEVLKSNDRRVEKVKIKRKFQPPQP